MKITVAPAPVVEIGEIDLDAFYQHGIAVKINDFLGHAVDTPKGVLIHCLGVKASSLRTS